MPPFTGASPAVRSLSVALLIFSLAVFRLETSFVCSLRAMMSLLVPLDRFTEHPLAGAAAHVAARIEILEPNRGAPDGRVRM